jgi:hypothetical protein
MNNIVAFVPKIGGKTEVQLKLHQLGGRTVSVEDNSNAFYNQYQMNVPDEVSIPAIVSYVVSNGGVVKVNSVYVESYHSKSHLEIAEEDDMLVSSDGVYITD